MEKTDKEIYNKKYYRANIVSNEILNAIESNFDANSCEELKKMVLTNSLSQKLLDDMVNVNKHQQYFEQLESSDKKRDIKNLIDTIHTLKRRRINRRIFISISSVAAAIMVFSFILFYSNNLEVPNKIILTETRNISTIKPIIIFDTGDTIPIEKHKEYLEHINTGKKIDSTLSRYNTVIIPVGYTYKMTLADGTSVTLNAGSRLKYPTVFNGVNREVELEGEAYFDVVKSNKKFIVNSSTSRIEVFGTRFNVHSKLNGDVEAVLVEGSIGFKSSNGDLFMITPGTKLSYISKNNSIATENVDTYTYTAWLDNKFVYKDQPLAVVMNDLATWYGIKVSSVKKIDDLTLTLVINRDTPIEDLMRVISLTLNINIIKEKGMEYTIK